MTDDADKLIAQVQGLRGRLLDTFKAWANGSGFAAYVDKWTIDHQGNPVNPLGDSCSYYEAACSLQRIAEMATLHPASLVSSFYYQKNRDDPPQLPCQLTKDGQAALIVWAIWDGDKLVGEAGDAPKDPAVLVSLEGCGPDLGKWTDPVKLYAFLEYGFRLGRYVQTTAEDPDEEDIPF